MIKTKRGIQIQKSFKKLQLQQTKSKLRERQNQIPLARKKRDRKRWQNGATEKVLRHLKASQRLCVWERWEKNLARRAILACGREVVWKRHSGGKMWPENRRIKRFWREYQSSSVHRLCRTWFAFVYWFIYDFRLRLERETLD